MNTTFNSAGFANRSRQFQHGFSLVEILVVLVIVGMISGVVMTGLADVFKLRERIGPFVDQSDETALIGSWYRKQIRGITPDVKTGRYIFSGGPKGLAGLTVMAIGGDPGAPIPFSLSIAELGGGKFSLQTRYDGVPSAFNLVSWRGDESGAEETGFQYFDGTSWSSVWPIPDKQRTLRPPPGQISTFGLDEPPQIPVLIRAQIVLGGQKMVLVAAPRQPDRPFPRLQDIIR